MLLLPQQLHGQWPGRLYARVCDCDWSLNSHTHGMPASLQKAMALVANGLALMQVPMLMPGTTSFTGCEGSPFTGTSGIDAGGMIDCT